MITIQSRADIGNITINKDDDIIPITVGLYRLFLAGGADGIDAKTLYEHLIFTARLQETQQVFANNDYLRKGLQWGVNKVKHAKAWLVAAGLIEYIQYRLADGTLSPVYIKLRFLLAKETLDRKLAESPFHVPDVPAMPAEEPVPEPDYQMDLFAEEEDGSTGGTFTAPPVHRTTGAEQQMLEANNEMLEVIKEIPPLLNANPSEMENAIPEPKKGRFWYNPNGPDAEAKSVGSDLCRRWYVRHQKETAVLRNPGLVDLTAATALVHQFPALCGVDGSAMMDKAVQKHFEHWKAAWYLTAEHTRKAPDVLKKPYWSFTNFCRFFGEILDLEAVQPVPSGAAGAGGAGAGQGGGRAARKVVTQEEADAIVARTMAKYENGGAS